MLHISLLFFVDHPSALCSYQPQCSLSDTPLVGGTKCQPRRQGSQKTHSFRSSIWGCGPTRISSSKVIFILLIHRGLIGWYLFFSQKSMKILLILISAWKLSDHLIIKWYLSHLRAQKLYSSARNYEWNLERMSNSSQSTRPVGRVLLEEILEEVILHITPLCSLLHTL